MIGLLSLEIVLQLTMLDGLLKYAQNEPSSITIQTTGESLWLLIEDYPTSQI